MDAIKGVTLIVIVTAMLFVAIVKVVGGSGSSSASTSRPGASSVYRTITATQDCSKLQVMFDTAADNTDREPTGSRLREVTESYMTAIDDHMRSIGCYG